MIEDYKKRKKLTNFKKDQMDYENMVKNSVKCKCGHSVYLYSKIKDVCSWCGNMVYRSDKDKFKDIMERKLRK